MRGFRYTSRMSSRNVSFFVLAVLSLLLVFVAFPLVQSTFGGRAGRTAFDRAAWMAADRTDATPSRVQMIDALLAGTPLRGMTRNQIIELLGEPPETEYFSDWDLVYWLGPERSAVSVDSEWLVLRFNEDSVVTDVAVLSD